MTKFKEHKHPKQHKNRLRGEHDESGHLRSTYNKRSERQSVKHSIRTVIDRFRNGDYKEDEED